MSVCALVCGLWVTVQPILSLPSSFPSLLRALGYSQHLAEVAEERMRCAQYEESPMRSDSITLSRDG